MRRRSWLTVAGPALVGLPLWFWALSGCGPSVQSIHEGSVRFEHCYRLDLELEVASGHRQACWVSWLKQYTFGQPRDRLDYAARRVRSFSTGDGSGPRLQLDAKQRDETRQFYLVVPPPTSVHGPPPPIATRVNASAPPPGNGTGGAAPSAAPRESCATDCRSAFAKCGEACPAESASGACASCDPDYRRCMQRCFE